jgi:hypothetical protein
MNITRLSPIVLIGVVLASGCGDDPSKKKNREGDSDQNGDCGGDSSCVDSHGAPLCPVNSGFDGDDLALCNAESEEDGISLHYGPKDYDDEEEVAKYLLGPYEEAENCVYIKTTNEKPVWIGSYHGRMRPQSHHLIVTVMPELPEGVELGEPTDCDQAEAVGSRWLLGAQDPQIDLDVEGSAHATRPAEPGDPEYGSAQKIEPGTILRINMHYVNTTDDELLRESWVYLKAIPEDEVKNVVDMITFFQGAINVPPQSEGVKTAIARCKVPSDRYVGMVTGHFHEHGTRFTVWHENLEGETTKVYDTTDWDLPGNAIFSDRIENPAFTEDGEIADGELWSATSGYLFVKEGEYINFQCEYENPTNETVTLGELGRDQMCNVFGFYYPSNGDVWACRCAGEVCF